MKSYEQMVEEDSLYIDSEDRETLAKYTETQREKIFYERYSKLMDLENRKKLELMGKKQDDIRINTVSRPEEPKEHLKFQDCDYIVTRDQIANNIFKPQINTFKGCFVRTKIVNDYKIGKILGFKKSRPYKISYINHFLSSMVVVDLGYKVKDLTLENLSSGKVTEAEFDEFRRDFGVSSLDDLRAHYKKAMAEISRSMTNNEVSAMIENRLAANPKTKTNTERKIEIILNRDQAIERKDKEKAKHYQKLLQQIEDDEKEERRKRSAREMEDAKRRLQNN